jgi:hypothetical protein
VFQRNQDIVSLGRMLVTNIVSLGRMLVTNIVSLGRMLVTNTRGCATQKHPAISKRLPHSKYFFDAEMHETNVTLIVVC